MTDLLALANEPFCYLTTVGRVTGRAHTIEIWFALKDSTLYMLSGNGDRADWVRNASRQRHVTIKLQECILSARARGVETEEEDALARRLLYEKYAPANADLREWADSSLPIAFDLAAPR